MKSRVSKERDVPGQTGTVRPVVPLSRDKKIFVPVSLCPGQGQEQMSQDKHLCPRTSQDKITFQKERKKQENDVPNVLEHLFLFKNIHFLF